MTLDKLDFFNLFLEPIPGAGGGAISFAGFGGGECVCPAGPLGPAGPAGPPGLEVKVFLMWNGLKFSISLEKKI